MTVDQLIDTLGTLWPKHCTTAWAAAWAPQYAAILGACRPDALDKAWHDTMAGWVYPKPPQPADILKHVAARAMDFGTSKRDAGGAPLAFGREHFQIRKAAAERLFDHWRRRFPDLTGDDDLPLYCRAEAWRRALAIAGRVVDSGRREPERSEAIAWSDDDTALCRARLESQRRVAPRGRMDGRAPIKALHVPGHSYGADDPRVAKARAELEAEAAKAGAVVQAAA